jgi:Ran GTPase-activating protein (RanGAP) involved in mRNA processing and transport
LASSDFARLKVLNINYNKICNKGISYLAKGNWPKLKALHLYQCSITVDGLKSIIHAPRRKMKMFTSIIDEVRMTNASSVHVLTKQYYPYIPGCDNLAGPISWKLKINEKE